jgi:phosphoenolpyruvate synthase/pyruvate phosphate dikinase
MLKNQGYPSHFVKLLTIAETQRLVTNGKLPPLTTLQKRSQGFVYIHGKLSLAPDIKKFFAKRGIELAEEQVDPNTTRLKGNTAYPGKPVVGKVRIVMNSDEVRFVRKGEILVSPMTSPDYVQAMQKSAAIVTDEGGITCHAAIVSRELKIPCVIGTRVATKVLQNGDTVTVDARDGTVTKIPTRH